MMNACVAAAFCKPAAVRTGAARCSQALATLAWHAAVRTVVLAGHRGTGKEVHPSPFDQKHFVAFFINLVLRASCCGAHRRTMVYTGLAASPEVSSERRRG